MNTNCKNCGKHLQEDAMYCAHCGQETKLAKVSIFTVIGTLLTEFFSLDNRFIDSLYELLKPGKLTRLYFSGKRKPFYSPVKFFLVVSFLFVLVSSFVFNNSELASEVKKGSTNFTTEINDNYNRLKIDSFFVQEIAKRPQDSVVLNELHEAYAHKYLKHKKGESTGGNYHMTIGGTRIKKSDFHRLSKEEFTEKYFKDKSWLERILVLQFKKIAGQGDSYIRYLIGQVGLTIIFFIPLFSLILWLVYMRRKRYYVEHLIFNFHFHVFAFLVILVLLIFYDLGYNTSIIWIGVAIIFVYLVMAVKRYYEQGWLKTLFKVGICSFAYVVLLLLVFSVTLLITMATF